MNVSYSDRVWLGYTDIEQLYAKYIIDSVNMGE